ncbi:glucosamine-6-phosphate deaminase [Escherichia coli]|nr:glucosamine-6-phosphate deaminase [Escherichia coli]
MHLKTNGDFRVGDAPRDKRTYFREINYIAAAFQYQKKNYNSA